MATADPRDAGFTGSVFRANFKNVIAKRSDMTAFNGGRIVPSAAGTTVTYEAGTVLGLVTATGKLRAYASANSDGSQVPVGVLAESTVVDEFGNGSEVGYITRGTLFKDFLIGLDANAITLLKGSAVVEHGVNLITIYA